MVEVSIIHKEGLSACRCCSVTDRLPVATGLASADRERRSPGEIADLISSTGNAGPAVMPAWLRT
jgi:hypothetical protein